MSGQPTYYISPRKPRPQRKYMAVHASLDCVQLRKKGVSVVELPAEFAPYFAACSWCMSRAEQWTASDERPPAALGRWYGAQHAAYNEARRPEWAKLACLAGGDK